MEENFDAFGFELSLQEVARVESLDTHESCFFDHRDPAVVESITCLVHNV